MSKRIVIALGGNALGKNPQEQLELVKNTATTIVDLVQDGYQVVVGHGNGPQVGMVNLAFETSANQHATCAMPFPECGAMTQGYIGYHLQQSIQRELKQRGIDKECVTVITQVVVDEHDPAFNNLSKPIGSFYDEETAKEIAQKTGYTFVEDAGRGYRRVVASPSPVRIVELKAIEQLIAAGTIVITVGGGGIPVIEDETGYQGIAAVIDKDRACSRLALDLKADQLVILTAVNKVCINYRKDNQQEIDRMTVAQAKEYIAEGQFAKGSMLPKIEACLDYVTNSDDCQAIIAALEEGQLALANKAGTVIVKK